MYDNDFCEVVKSEQLMYLPRIMVYVSYVGIYLFYSFLYNVFNGYYGFTIYKRTRTELEFNLRKSESFYKSNNIYLA